MGRGAAERFWLSIRGNARWFVVTMLFSFLGPIASGFFTWLVIDWRHVGLLVCGVWFAVGVVLAVINVRHIMADTIVIPPVEVLDQARRPAVAVSTAPNFVPSPEVGEQLSRLNLFQLCVIAMLLKYGQLDGDALTYRLMGAGFPIGTEHERKEVAATAFQRIDGWTTLIAETAGARVWVLRDPASVKALLLDCLARTTSA